MPYSKVSYLQLTFKNIQYKYFYMGNQEMNSFNHHNDKEFDEQKQANNNSNHNDQEKTQYNNKLGQKDNTIFDEEKDTFKLPAINNRKKQEQMPNLKIADKVIANPKIPQKNQKKIINNNVHLHSLQPINSTSKQSPSHNPQANTTPQMTNKEQGITNASLTPNDSMLSGVNNLYAQGSNNQQNLMKRKFQQETSQIKIIQQKQEREEKQKQQEKSQKQAKGEINQQYFENFKETKEQQIIKNEQPVSVEPKKQQIILQVIKSFDKIFKSPTISFQDKQNKISVQSKFYYQNNKIILTEPITSLLSQCTFRLDNIKYCLGVGVALKQVIEKHEYTYKSDSPNELNHGLYIVTTQGYSWSHSEKEHDDIFYAAFKQVYSGVSVNVKLQGEQLIFSWKRGSFKMYLPSHIRQKYTLTFCAYLHEKDDSISII